MRFREKRSRGGDGEGVCMCGVATHDDIALNCAQWVQGFEARRTANVNLNSMHSKGAANCLALVNQVQRDRCWYFSAIERGTRVSVGSESRLSVSLNLEKVSARIKGRRTKRQNLL